MGIFYIYNYLTSKMSYSFAVLVYCLVMLDPRELPQSSEAGLHGMSVVAKEPDESDIVEEAETLGYGILRAYKYPAKSDL